MFVLRGELSDSANRRQAREFKLNPFDGRTEMTLEELSLLTVSPKLLGGYLASARLAVTGFGRSFWTANESQSRETAEYSLPPTKGFDYESQTSIVYTRHLPDFDPCNGTASL